MSGESLGTTNAVARGMKTFFALPAMLAGVLAIGCASAPPPPAETPAVSPPRAEAKETPVESADGPVCDVVCERAKVTAVTTGSAAIADAETYTIKETENANDVMAAMHDDLLACYKARVRVVPTAHGTLTLDILIGADGKVRKIDTTGGDTLGTAKDCIVKRVQNGAFDPPHGGGTLKIQVPVTLRLQNPDEST